MKNIIFDLAGVILKGSSFSILDKFDIKKEEKEQLINFFKDWTNIDLGIESIEEKYKRCNFNKELDKYKEILLNYFKYREFDEELIKLMKELKNDYKIYILSDNNKPSVEYYKTKLDVDGYVISCDYNCKKKDGKLFQILLDKYNLNPLECYFVDDLEENIKMANKFNIKGYIFDNVDNLYKDLIKNKIIKKNIIFDWGGVILKEYPNHYCDRDAIVDTIKKFNKNLNFEEAYQLYLDTLNDENNNIISIYNDDINKYKWYERINKKGNLNTTYYEFINEFINNYKKIDKYDEVVNLIYSLKDKVNLYLFSDLIFTCFESLKNHIDLNIFNKVFLSYEQGYVKKYINAFLNVKSKIYGDVLFIDNNLKNIENAKKIGWNTLCTTGDNIDKIKEEINNFIESL